MEIRDYNTAQLEEIVRGDVAASDMVVSLAKKELKRRTPGKALCKKIEEGLIYTGIMGSGVVYWIGAERGAEMELRTITGVHENGRERSRKIARLNLQDDLYLICAIQRHYPKVTGFIESLDHAWDEGKLPITLAEIYALAGVK